ncbi:hypothetical protein [Shewanella sp. YLB-07]|uniref:hypothetical protein n=1 Tax=Shewanella sp. YLB-07 TaxID=2601268 RepID=UPI00128D642A|nr:hypothetical protein [Shewanella sp. YLB-07]MPY24380.1 hypothetical protein [Shewanella sp. YLB-07]
MANLTSLQAALSSVVPATGFMLDNRTVLSKLQFIEQYAQAIPYPYETDPRPFDSWADFLFMEGNTPEVLAELYRKPRLADGNLQPHQAMLFSMLTMLETPQALMNYFPHAHRDLYYRSLLGLKERAAAPSQVALAVELNQITPELRVPKGTLFSAGQDDNGTKIEYGLDADVFANHSRWRDLRWCYPGVSGSAKCAVVYGDDRDWNEQGVRLFDDIIPTEPVLTGRMLIADAFTQSEGDTTFVITLASVVDSARLTGHISGGDKWLDLSLSTTGSSQTLTFTLPASEGEISPPEALPGAPFDKPVLRIARQDGEPLPLINTVTVNHQQVANFEQVILTPFGYANHAMPSVDNMQLYIGIDDMLPGQTLSLFWQLNSPQPLDTQWQYLNHDNQWHSLEQHVVDFTHGLSGHGVWSVVLPDDASSTVTVMPTGRYWIRAVISPVGASTPGIADYPWLTGILTNGMTATLTNVSALDADRASQPLPAESITQPVTFINGVSGVVQPWRSVDGKAAETHHELAVRAAQRLAHRKRAMTWPDMVMLLKTEFPWVFDALIPSGDILTTVPALTQQILVVLPLVTEKDNDDVLRPMFNAARLERMSLYLQDLASSWQDIRVVNPRYRNVSLAYQVVFKEGVNPNYAEQQLRQSITDHYMPWGVGNATSIVLANHLGYYDILTYIQQQSYVDHVLNLTLNGAEDSVQGVDDEVLVLQWFE